jgi:hypothetical protein
MLFRGDLGAIMHIDIHPQLLSCCRFYKMNIKQLIYMATNLFYLGGWVIALAGLAASQKSCKDNESSWPFSADLMASTVGEDCKKFFRYVLIYL